MFRGMCMYMHRQKQHKGWKWLGLFCKDFIGCKKQFEKKNKQSYILVVYWS